MLPFLFLSPVGGILADRWDRRHIMAATSLYQTCFAVALGILVMFGDVRAWHIMAYALGIGLSFPLIEPARVSLLARIVPKESIVNAFALNGLAVNVSRLIFPFMGGLLISIFGPGESLVIAGAIFVAAAVTVLSITVQTTTGKFTKKRSAALEFKEAVIYVKGEPTVLGILLIGVLIPMMYVPSVNRMMPVYASEVFAVGPTGLGLLMGSLGAGSTLSSISLAVLGNISYKGRVIIGALALTGLGMLVFSRLDHLIEGVLTLILLSGIVSVYWNLGSATLQLVVSDEFRGRVASLATMSMGFFPFGSLIFGGIAQAHGAQTATTAAGIALLFCTIILSLRFSAVFQYR